jgi:asparagine synthase (glutamine-hydrolysing)
MFSSTGRYSIVFNGEIYNFRELRASLEKEGVHDFRGSSDTEIMLAAFEQWGIRDSVQRFNGMFAFAVWDRRERLLSLARDRAGEKPLYYAWMGRTFLFGSELKSLRAHPSFRAEINRGSLALFLRLGYVPAPYSIYKGVWKLPPATILTVKDRKSDPSIYWSAKEVAEYGCSHPANIDDVEATERLESLLSGSIRLRMISDVPLGAFLSGGIDSSAVVALMQAHCRTPVKTYTIGFHESGYDEARHAKAVARHLDTDHTELYVTSSDAIAVVPSLPSLYDEPFADSSQIPTFLVSKLARRNVTVSLSGDGGDEVFGGYTRYLWGEEIWRRFGWLPAHARRAIASLAKSVSPHAWDRLFKTLGPVLPASLAQTNPGNKLHKFAEILEAESPEAMYLALVSQWKNPRSIVVDSFELPTLLTQRDEWPGIRDFAHRMMFLDTVTYLPDDILVKLDRASMGVSLESRVPLLDHRIIEFAWQLPLRMKIRERQSKWLLRQVLYKYVPPELVNRPKAGFGIPIHQWLRGPLRSWAEELLDAGRLRREGFFDPGPIREKWDQHLSGKYNWMYPLWNVLMFQAWLEAEAVPSEVADSVPASASN